MFCGDLSLSHLFFRIIVHSENFILYFEHPAVKKWLDTKQATMTPVELLHNVLKMPVDLIWNGGIGTYVKATKESDSDVGDRANDAVRVNGYQLNAKIIGEGGNLGCTQLGRIEYAKHGGKINTDFIDNVGGVDCSDNEVNIKILLNTLVSNGDLTVKIRIAHRVHCSGGSKYP